MLVLVGHKKKAHGTPSKKHAFSPGLFWGIFEQHASEAIRRERKHEACSTFSQHQKPSARWVATGRVHISVSNKSSQASRQARSHRARPPFRHQANIRSHPPSAQPAGVFIFRQLEHIRSHPPSAQPLGVFTFQTARTHQKPSAKRTASGRVHFQAARTHQKPSAKRAATGRVHLSAC